MSGSIKQCPCREFFHAKTSLQIYCAAHQRENGYDALFESHEGEPGSTRYKYMVPDSVLPCQIDNFDFPIPPVAIALLANALAAIRNSYRGQPAMPADHDEAWEWIMGASAPVTFEMAVQSMGIDPEQLRQLIIAEPERMIAAITKLQTDSGKAGRGKNHLASANGNVYEGSSCGFENESANPNQGEVGQGAGGRASTSRDRNTLTASSLYLRFRRRKGQSRYPLKVENPSSNLGGSTQ